MSKNKSKNRLNGGHLPKNGFDSEEPSESPTPPTSPDPDSRQRERYLRVKEASDVSGLPVGRLNYMRSAGGSPPYIKIGKTVLYKESELIAWLDARTVSSTSEEAGGIAR